MSSLKIFNLKINNKYIKIAFKIICPTYISFILYSIFTAENFASGFKIFSIIFLVSNCAFTIGAFLGFLFGFPIQKNNDFGDKVERNSSLKEITDWLTKIIVGITLVELKSIFSYLKDLIRNFSSLVDFDDTLEIIFAATIIEFFLIGFILLYILTITSFFKYLVENDNHVAGLLSSLNNSFDSTEVKIQDINFEDLDNVSNEAKSKILNYIYKNGVKLSDITQSKKLAKFLFMSKEYSYAADAYEWCSMNNKDLTLKLNEAYIRSKYLKEYDKSNSILKSIIKDNNYAPAFYNLACNYNREYKDLHDEVGEYRNKILEKVELNLKNAFTIDKGLYSEAIKDPELSNLKNKLKNIFENSKK